jgi:KUP system potassium uptake protein
MTEDKHGPLLALGALGVVYGDIGTSPLYALRETMGNLPITELNVFGVLSLVFWTLILVVSIKYFLIIFQADNDGEGGILALLALFKQKSPKRIKMLYWVAMIGAGLLLGDGMLTPAISVTSAVEGVHLIYPHAQGWVLGIVCCILLLLFAFQRRGSTKIGMVFGPVILVWFIVIAGLGVVQLLDNPVVLQAVNPYYAFEFLYLNGWHGFFLLGGVFLVVTGGEALYADIGHFGKGPIRWSWFLVVLPCLLMNYFGQGVVVLAHPEAIVNPFYWMVSNKMLIPMILLATCASVIASQAIISATFSLTRQGILLGVVPRFPMIQTSKQLIGQIYIPQMNFILLCGSLFLIFLFHDSSGLANAYGIGINLQILLVTGMVAYAAYKLWDWSYTWILGVFSVFIGIDLLFLGANLHKFLTGGWVPVCFSIAVALVMFTWKNGMEYLQRNVYRRHTLIETTSRQLQERELTHIPKMNAIFITDQYDHTGSSFLHFLKMTLSFAEHILVVSCNIANKPYVHHSRRCVIRRIDPQIYELTLHYGFMERISIPQALTLVNSNGMLPFYIDLKQVTYWVEVLHVVASKLKKTLWFFWQERLFAFLLRNYPVNLNIEFYRLPYEQTIAIGTYTIL